jgi:hypothetical protein
VVEVLMAAVGVYVAVLAPSALPNETKDPIEEPLGHVVMPFSMYHW